MKLTTKSAVLLATLVAASTTATTVVSAVDSTEATVATELPSTGTVTITEGGDTKDPGLVDPEKPGLTDPKNPDEIIDNPVKGPLKLEKVSNLNFGQISSSTAEITKYASPIAVGTGSDTRGAMVQFADIRSGASGYDVQVKMSQQFTGKAKNKVLSGATITYNNTTLRSEVKGNVLPTTVTPGNIVIGEDGAQQSVVKATKGTDSPEGKGRFVLEFGRSATYNEADVSKDSNVFGTAAPGTDKESVKLTVPTTISSNLVADEYTAKIQWSIVAAK